MELGPSSRVGPYVLLDRLGAGGMGEVYRARDVRLDRVVAIKVLRGDRVSDIKFRQSLIHEARALSALNHAHVAALFDVVTQGGSDFLVMEYVPGASLERVLKDGKLAPEIALRFAVQIADALAAAHARAIIHRDLKPSNVAITPEGSIKLLDFGIAKHIRPEAAGDTRLTGEALPTEGPTVMAGTPSYMSPEQVTGAPLDGRTDIFAFGALLYEMLTGERAFERDTKLATAAAILHDEPRPIRELAPETPPELVAVVARCLQKERGRRFRRMADVKQLLDHIEDVWKVASAAGTPRRQFRAWMVAAAGLGGAALLAALFTGVWQPASAPVEHPITAEPLTSYPGLELLPACSPDGAFVAFQWDGPQQRNWDIYVKILGTALPSRLTTDEADDLSPAWSPDNRQIAFVRVEAESARVIVIPSVGTAQERIVGTIPLGRSYNWPADGRLLAWTPDGNWIAVPWPDRDGNTRISLLHALNGERRDLTRGPSTSGRVHDRNPAFSWDGRHLVFARAVNSSADIFLLPLGDGYRPAGEPRALTSGPGFNDSPAWSPDGREIFFHSTRSGNDAIWLIPAAGRRAAHRLPGVGDNGISPTVSRLGRLVYVNKTVVDTNIWRLGLKGKVGAPVRLASSSRIETLPDIAPNGQRIAFESNRLGPDEIWLAQSDGLRAAPLTKFGRGHTGTPRWSPDGRTIAFDSNISGQFQVYTLPVEGGEPRQVTKASDSAAIPAWSQDGRWIYYTGTDSGREEIWKSSIDGLQAIRVTSDGGSVPFESRDGRLYYLRGGALWWMPRDGGSSRRIIERVLTRNYAVTQHRIWFERAVEPSGSAIFFYSFATQRETEIHRTLQPTHNGLAVSSDESWLLFTGVDQDGSDLMVAELRR